MKHENNESTTDIRSKIFPVSIGLLFGISFGTSMHSWVMGVCMGFLWAIVFGLYDDEGRKDQEDNK
ncbi:MULTISPECIES: hypothetical protein [unclassified Butyrivibrio]|uniref:hypothetical protein n=1 Tax=unclassified Butyrivibrio TaxID=2639466 RepID=UPI000426C1B7|nr:MULTISPECIES: hypothetical protein [unclassified Butyrivibrio]